METIHLVRANCGDYYCGCGGGHVIGVYSTPDLAQAAKEAAEIATTAHVADPTRTYPTWKEVGVEPITLDRMPAIFELVGSPTTTPRSTLATMLLDAARAAGWSARPAEQDTANRCILGALIPDGETYRRR